MTEKEYTTIMVVNRLHVVCPAVKRATQDKDGNRVELETANYLGKGLTLCGVLKNGETLQQWQVRKANFKPVDE